MSCRARNRTGIAILNAAGLGLCLVVRAAVASPSAVLPPVELTEQAVRLVHGEGVEPDVDKAVTYLCAAARQGHGPAAFELGWLYLNGRGVANDDALAAAWLREAERLGEAPPAGVLAHLASAPTKPLLCVGRAGDPLDLADARRAQIAAVVHRLAPRYGLDPALVVEVIRAESGFNPKARSAKGALGLMQLIPSTAARFGVSDPLQPIQNLRGGMAYLSWLLGRFDGDLRLVLAGYNAGEGAVQRYGGVPPYAETRAYVRKILERYGKRSHPVPPMRMSALSGGDRRI